MQSVEFWIKKLYELLDGGLEIVPLTVAAANTPAIASDATALAANANRVRWSIQNLGTNALYVRYGTGASTTVFHVALKAGAVNDDGVDLGLGRPGEEGVLAVEAQDLVGGEPIGGGDGHRYLESALLVGDRLHHKPHGRRGVASVP